MCTPTPLFRAFFPPPAEGQRHLAPRAFNCKLTAGAAGPAHYSWKRRRGPCRGLVKRGLLDFMSGRLNGLSSPSLGPA